MQKQFGVRAGLYRATVLDDHNTIGATHGREAVGDNERRSSLHEAIERLQDEAFAGRIERAGGLVKNENGRIARMARAMATRWR